MVVVGHFEVPARDFARQADFFRQALGFAVEPLAWEGAPYAKLRLPHAPAPARAIGGGLVGAAGLAQPLVVFHVEGESLPAVLARIVGCGGTIDVPPKAVGELGYFAQFRDPEGHLFGLWQASGVS
jgi:predicted enzyme related to lactoylglutathione lyase